MAKKLLKPKRGKVENLSKLAVEDGALVFAYDTKATTSTVLVDIGDTRYDLAAGAARKADNADALGGSSLQNIVDKINNSTGDGTAFTGLDTTTNNKVKLTRANGGTVEKTINNVSNASTADYAKNSDKLDGYHETAFLRYRGATNTSADSLWNQIGIKEFYKCYPENLDGVYNYGEVVSLPGASVRFDIWVNHLSSSGEKNGLQYRSGWNDDKKPWRMLLDSGNFSQYAAKKNAYNSASISNATITLGRSDGSTGTTLTVNNVAHASTADLAKNSNALGGSSLKNITDKINSSIAANDAMHYMGTLGATAQKPTITALPTTARIGDAYKVITAGTYASITAEVGDLFIYSGSWTLIPSGDDGNVYVGDSKSSKFVAKSNNIVVAVGDQKVASAANVTANAGTISALQSTMTQLKANQGTVTTLNGNKATFSTVNGYLNGNADSATRLKSQGVAPSAISGTARHAQAGVQMMEIYNSSGYPTSYGNTLIIKGDTHSGESQLAFGWSGSPSMFVRSRDDWAEHNWTDWSRFILSTDALTSSASAISSTNNYFTAGATTAYVAAKTASAVGNYLPLTGGTLTGPLISNSYIQASYLTGESNGDTWQYKKAHGIQLGIPSRDYCNFYEFGGVWNFYKTNEVYTQASGDGTLIAKIDASGFHGNLVGVASTATLASTANYANNSGALGGSSLSQVLASAGEGNAFTAIDTATNNVIKLTRANGGTVQKIVNNVSNASSASYATISAYPQGFSSRTTSATWGNTTGSFITGWHTSSGGDVAFMNDNPSNGKVSMKLDGYFYQNEGSKRVLDTDDIDNIVQEANKIISITKSITLKTDWQDTGIEGTDLETGTYIVQISGIENNSTPGIYGEIWSGIFSWYSKLTNSTNAEEILLHNAGHADNSNEIYLRTIRQGREIGKLKLQIAAKQAGKSAADVVFKFRKMI